MDSTVVSLVGRILETASSIKTLGDEYYKASAAWEKFGAMIWALRKEYEEFMPLWRRIGIQYQITDADRQKELHSQVSSAQAERARLERALSAGACVTRFICFKITPRAFPGQLNVIVQSAAEALRDGRAALSPRAKFYARDKKALSWFTSDPLYVHLEETETEVYEALEDPSKPAVVVLHGGAGAGKSTLARHIAFNYTGEDQPVFMADAFDNIDYKRTRTRHNTLDHTGEDKSDSGALYNEESIRRISSYTGGNRPVPSSTAFYSTEEILARNFSIYTREDQTVPMCTGFCNTGEGRLPSRTGSADGQKVSKFQHVFYLECGPKADVREKKLELLELLQYLYLDPSHVEDRNSFTSTAGVDVRVMELLYALPSLRSDRSILIILDDVWETEFLQKFVDFFGRKVKCLVTSQNVRLWNSSWSIPIKINFLEARSILARHAGLVDVNAIPLNLQNILDSIVEDTEGQPLALASLASAISKKRPTDIDEWRDAKKSLLNLLKEEVREPVYNRKYPRSFWAAMKLSVESIPDGAQKLLLVASICAGPSIPEEVISIFSQHNKMTEVVAAFSKRRNDLEDRSFLTIKSQPLSWDKDGSGRTWCLHRLQKVFIRTEMSDQIEDLFTAFLGERKNADGENRAVDTLAEVIRILCAFYCEGHLAERAARKLGLEISDFSEIRRRAMEPIIWLIHIPVNEKRIEISARVARKVLCDYVRDMLVKEEDIHHLLTDEEWSETSAAVARKVLRDYICDKQVKEEGINHLLSLPFSKKAAYFAYMSMSRDCEKTVA